MAKAQSHQLYIKASDNQKAAEIAQSVLARFNHHSGMDYANFGTMLGILVILFTPWPLNPVLSINEAALTVAAAVCALLVLYPAATVSMIYINASVAMQGLPQSRFKMDIHASDGRLGIGELIDLLVAGICFNVTSLMLLWFVGLFALDLVPMSENWWKLVIYQVLAFLPGLNRVAGLRRLWKVRRSVKESFSQTISEETNKLKDIPIAERLLRQQHIDRLKWFPILTIATRGRIKYVVTTILIPLLFLVADKAYTAWTETPAVIPRLFH